MAVHPTEYFVIADSEYAASLLDIQLTLPATVSIETNGDGPGLTWSPRKQERHIPAELVADDLAE